MAEAPKTPLRAQVDQKIAEATKPHAWLYNAIVHDVEPDPSQFTVEGILAGVMTILGATINAIDLFAAEIDNLKGHSEPPVR
jgi:hypothetical protein